MVKQYLKANHVGTVRKRGKGNHNKREQRGQGAILDDLDTAPFSPIMDGYTAGRKLSRAQTPAQRQATYDEIVDAVATHGAR